ncbi:hypothetical protein JJL45_05175 [Tamlana sp. s12]|uniref:hypothetical protein n=1 Tax=Tamlana sp. s12 TaxID=1630406 RepID=UPI0007FCC5F8|nr:hypothetical protein [Tamlana sp. s12]OBQ56104.1 hypothetical protein VQ01_06885 [Tamlana sp. s12]QQY83383.1 hypothetical protein JJL45_05175 [Tamlana sp. s12]
MTRRQNLSKYNAYKLSNQVKSILHKKGYSSVFNYSDYEFFKTQCKDAFNKAVSIADKFIEENTTQTNDFNEYIF